jgi:hypothetical protein
MTWKGMATRTPVSTFKGETYGGFKSACTCGATGLDSSGFMLVAARFLVKMVGVVFCKLRGGIRGT